MGNHPPKCRQFVRRKALADHRANCNFRVMQCPIEGCEEELQARGLRAHMNACVYRRVSCLNRRGENQCDWVGMHKDLTDHESECPYKIVQCSIPDTEMAGGSCQERFHRCDLPGHQKNCAYQKTRCTICNLEVSKRHIGVHEAHCDARWYQCPACGEKVHHKRRAQHYQTSCSMVAVKCEYAPYGCTVKPLKKDYMDHLKEAAGAHLQMVMAASGEGYEAVVQQHQRREADLARDLEVGIERVRDYEREADGLKVSIAQSAEQHVGSAESLDRLVAQAGDRAAAASQALLEEVEVERSNFQERCFRSYTEAQGLYRRVHQDTVPSDSLDSCCLEFDVAATASIEAHTLAEREVQNGRAVARAVMEPTLSRLALMDLREDQLLQHLREKIGTTHTLVTEKALACWRHLHTTGVPGRIEQIGRVQARLEHRLEMLEAGSYITADEVLQLSQTLKLRERLPEVVELKRLYMEVADSLGGGGERGGSDVLSAHIASEAPVFEITRTGEEGAGSETAGEGAVLNAIQLIENARWARRAAEDSLLQARNELGARETRVAALEDQVTKLKDARYCLEQSDAHAPTLEYLEEILGLTRAYLARLQGEVLQGGETLHGLAQALAKEAREVTATEAEVASLGDDLVATTDQPAVAALARALAVDPKASVAVTGGGGLEMDAADEWGGDGGLPLVTDMDVGDFECEDRIYEDLVESENFNVPEMADGLEACQEEIAFAEQRISDIEASLEFLMGRPDESAEARESSEALVDKWRRRLGNALARREALLEKLPFRTRAHSTLSSTMGTATGAPVGHASGGRPSGTRGMQSPAAGGGRGEREPPAGRPLAYPSGGPGPVRPQVEYAPATFPEGPRFGASRQLAREGEWYQGQWLKGRVHGRGRYRWPDGTVYEGACADNHLAGSGEMAYANGDAYIGQWARSRRHGIGKFKAAGGDTYYGDWERGQKSGQGVMHFATGDQYEGSWRGGEQNGYGKFMAWSGEVTSGVWEGGELLESIEDPAEYEKRAQLSWKVKARTRAWAKGAQGGKAKGGGGGGGGSAPRGAAVPALNPLDSLGLKMPNVPSLRRKFVMRR